MNKIIQRQNTTKFVDLLAAQRQLYSESKKNFSIRIFTSLLIAIGGSILITNFEDTRYYVYLASIIYIIIEMVIEEVEKNKIKNASKIQEYFDIKLFDLEWNEVLAGEKPELELVFKKSTKFKKKFDINDLLNWYPEEITTLNKNKAVLTCQRSNLWWDIDLRKLFLKTLYFLAFISITLGLFVFLKLNITFESFITVLFLFIPLLKFLINQIINQHKTINLTLKLKGALESKIEKLAKENAIQDSDLRKIQDSIYSHRKSCLPLPDWLYKRLKNTYEKQMRYNAKKLTVKNFF